MRSLLLAPVLFLTLPGQTAATATGPAPATLATYHSDALRLSYSYPREMVDASALVGTALQAGMPDTPESKCISLPFARMSSARGHASIVVLARAEADCMKRHFNSKSVADLTRGEAEGLSASGAKAAFGESQQYTVAGRPASRMQGTFALPTGQRMQAMVVCILDQPDIACWQFLGSAASDVEALGQLPVTFDGEAPTPLIPTK